MLTSQHHVTFEDQNQMFIYFKLATQLGESSRKDMDLSY